MVTKRKRWEDLPHPVRDAVLERTGPVLGAESAGSGANSAVAASLLLASGGRVFVKGLPSGHPRVWTQRREAAVGPYVQPVAPRLLWHLERAGWSLLGFEHLSGPTADFSPGSADIPLAVEALTALGRLRCPDIEVKRATARWTAYLDDPADAALFDGDALLHTDWNPTNVIVRDSVARVVDWAWPTRGASWIDPACWVVWLTAEGHAPDEAERWAAKIPSWTAAPDPALDLFASAQARLWRGIADDALARDWTRRLAGAAARWARHRAST
ncbi:phosphotransferase family protein [Streptomyces daliensis]